MPEIMIASIIFSEFYLRTKRKRVTFYIDVKKANFSQKICLPIRTSKQVRAKMFDAMSRVNRPVTFIILF